MNELENTEVERATYSEIECAHRIGVATVTLFRWRQAGMIPYVKVGRRILYRREAIDAWLAKREHATAT